MNFKTFMSEISNCLGVHLSTIENLFCGCSYLGEAIPNKYEDELFLVNYSLDEVDECSILEYANTHENPDYDLHENEDIVIKEGGYILSKLTGKKISYVLSIHRHVKKDSDNGWDFSGMVSLEYYNVKIEEE